MNKILLNTAYFPPVQYFSEIKESPGIIIERYDHYTKQSYRNRCDILTANGVMSLSVPIVKGASSKTLTRDTLIDYSTNWQKIHFRAIESAYKNSPYYDYYMDDLLPLIERKEKYLLDLNTGILHALVESISLHRTLEFTNEYNPAPVAIDDLRDTIHPKASRRRPTVVPHRVQRPYHQTFAGRFPFIPGLSILDLLFNTGPETIDFL